MIISQIGLCVFLGGVNAMTNPVIQVSQEGWGQGRPEDVQVLLNSVYEQYRPHIVGLKWPSIIVVPFKDTPITFEQRDAEGRVWIGLNACDRHWSQYSFQFGHELVHVIAGHLDVDRQWSNVPVSFRWFEESLGEAGSLFVLRSMFRDWERHPPYLNWAEYRQSLWEYSQERLDRPQHNLPPGQSFNTWLNAHEAYLRTNYHDRASNSIVARQLLPLFERNPDGWKAVAYLRFSQSGPEMTIDDHLNSWRVSCPENLRPFVTDLAKALGFTLSTNTVVQARNTTLVDRRIKQ